MNRFRTFLAAGLAFVVFGGWALGFWYLIGWPGLARTGTALVGMGFLLVVAGLYFRRQGWE